MKKINWKGLLPYAVAIVVFVLLAVLYCSPLLKGQVLQAGDVMNWKGASQEVHDYLDAENRQIWWTNAMFGGMPTFQVAGPLPSGSVRSTLEGVSHLGLTQDFSSAGIIVGYLTGFFLMLICFGINPWLSIAGAIALTLSSYFMLILPAGHITKAIALGTLAPVIGGMYAIFRKKYWLGAPLMLIYGIIGITHHPQMTYYMVMLMGVMGCAELYIHLREKRFKDLGISLAVLLACVLLIFGTRISWWQMNQAYLAETMRGGHSELTPANDSVQSNGGLDLTYATDWSYGKAETLTLLIPEYMGGCSGYRLEKNSQLEKDMKHLGVPGAQAREFCTNGVPTYWGEKPFTSGPVYVGAIICLLFFLGLLIVPGPYKWALIFATLASILLAWGKNFMGLTELFFQYFPMYNKFRAVESILVVAEVSIPLLGFLGLKQLAEHDGGKKDVRKILIAGGVSALVCLYVALFGGSFDVSSSYDAQWKEQVGPQIYDLILNQRHAMMTASAWRSLLFVLLGTAVLWVYCKTREKKYSTYGLAAVLGLLILMDMIPVNQHYFNKDNFVSKREDDRTFVMQPWEEEILKDQSLDYRVLNLTTNTFNDARTSYRLKSIGGYHAAKLRRYQDLIDQHLIAEMNPFLSTLRVDQTGAIHVDAAADSLAPVLNMLNMKYAVVQAQQGAAPVVVQNPYAMGNAWFVDEVKFVATPDEECAALKTLDLHKTAVADKKFKDVLSIKATGKAASDDKDFIRLTNYGADRLEYDFQASRDRMVVFSEIYYPQDWHLYVDDKEISMGRANYVLRAAVIPSGHHTIRMEFVPSALKTDKLCYGLFILIILLSIAGLSYPLWRKNKA